MKQYRFKSLSITSNKKPYNTHLIWEMSNGDIIMVDSSDQTDLIISDDKGDNWNTVDTGSFNNGVYSRTHKIQSGLHDRANSKIWFIDCDNDDVQGDFDVWYISTSTYNVTSVGTSTTRTTAYAYDIFRIGSNTYACVTEDRAGTELYVIWDVDAAPFSEVDTVGTTDIDTQTFGYGVVVGTDYYIWHHYTGLGSCQLHKFESSTSDFNNPMDTQSNTQLSTSSSQWGMSYDDTDILIATLKDTSDANKIKLFSYSISGAATTKGSEANVAIMLDRNNAATVPSEIEKAFGMTNEITYEVKPRRGGIVQLQDLSDELSNNIIGITDNFLIDDGGAMYEYTDVSAYMNFYIYYAGIVPYRSVGYFQVHPDYSLYWCKGDSVKIYDDSDNLEHWGKIIAYSVQDTGLYEARVDAFSNEIFRRTHEESYATKKTSEIIEDIIDDSGDYCYYSSSITATATQYSYDYNRALAYIFELGRFLERQVYYIEPDGKVWAKDYDSLTATGESWDLVDNTENTFLVDIPNIDEKLPGFFDGSLGITRTIVRYKNNTTTIRPSTYAANEVFGIVPLNEYRDPKLQAATEAQQLGDNLYNIFSAATKFIGLKIEGETFFQPGKTIQIENTGQITISQDNFVIVYFIRDAKQSNYFLMVLSDNIIYPSEFSSFLDTSDVQQHQTAVQAMENQEAIAGLVSDTAYDATTWNAVTTIAPSKNAVRDIIESIDGAPGTTVYQNIPIRGDDNSIPDVTTNAIGEYVLADFQLVSGKVDASADVTFHFVYACAQDDAALAMKYYCAATATDNSENQTWGIENGTGFNMVTTATMNYIESYTFANAGIAVGDWLRCMFMVNEASRTIYWRCCYVQFTHA